MALGAYLGAGSGITKGLYHLDGNANDSSGNSANGTATNVTWQGGKIGSGSANFGTSGNTSSVRTSSTLGIDGGVCTFSAWVKKNVNITSGKYSFALYQKNGNSKIEYRLGIDNANGVEKVGFTRGKIGIADNDCNFAYTQDTTTFHHWCGTYDGTNIKFYLDGTLKATLASSGNGGVNVYTDGFSIGNNNDNSSFIQNALTVDEGIIENRVWSASEIRKYYTYSKGFY